MTASSIAEQSTYLAVIASSLRTPAWASCRSKLPISVVNSCCNWATLGWERLLVRALSTAIKVFDAAIHELRLVVERTFAWEDKFKRLLLRFERIQSRHLGFKRIAYALINLRRFCPA